jgi:hypothetical protein
LPLRFISSNYSGYVPCIASLGSPLRIGLRFTSSWVTCWKITHQQTNTKSQKAQGNEIPVFPAQNRIIGTSKLQDKSYACALASLVTRSHIRIMDIHD